MRAFLRGMVIAVILAASATVAARDPAGAAPVNDAFANAAVVASVPFAAVLACTNEVGSRGRAEWLQWKDGAAAATSRLVLAWLADGLRT